MPGRGRSLDEYLRERRDQADLELVTARCAWCGWSYGDAREARAAAFLDRVEQHSGARGRDLRQ